MSRQMGDAIRINATALVALHLPMVAGYDTGSVDIMWKPSTWAMFPGDVQVHIDQGNGPRSPSANVIDVETGAFNPDQAEALINESTCPDPTVYVNRSNLDATVASAMKSPKFLGAVWLSFPGWNPGDVLPPLPAGCRYVAIQNRLDVNNEYDLSEVLDPAWPEGRSKVFTIPGVPGTWQGVVEVTNNADGSVVVVGHGTDGNVYAVKAVAGRWGAPTKV